MLSRQAGHALKALLELAREPQRWRSTRELATAQQLPEPMLEQLLLRLRRAGLLEARRGRRGGYRLTRPAAAISVAEVIGALGDATVRGPAAEPEPGASERVTASLEQRLRRAQRRALAEVSLKDLLFDLRSAEAAGEEGGGLLLG